VRKQIGKKKKGREQSKITVIGEIGNRGAGGIRLGVREQELPPASKEGGVGTAQLFGENRFRWGGGGVNARCWVGV